MVSFDTESVVGSSWGYTQSFGAISPSTGAAVGYDPLRLEKLHAFDISVPSSVVYRGTMEAGLAPEGDCPRRVAFTPDGTRLASGSNDTTIRIWSVETGESLLELRGHTSYVFDLVFSADGTRLFSASGDRTVRMWESARLGAMTLSDTP